MPLDRLTTQIPSTIGDLTISLRERVIPAVPARTLPDGTVIPAVAEQLVRAADAEVVILDQDGRVMQVWRGDLIPHLTDAQKVWLVQFVTDMRAKAVSELLPTV